MRRRKQEAVRTETEGVVAEAEAVINGSLLDRLPRDDSAPGWMWVSALAHADWPSLCELAGRTQNDIGSAWERALRFLAGELLLVAGSPEGLRSVQQVQLIPLELDLLAGTGVAPANPVALVNVLRAQFARFRSRQAHPSGRRSFRTKS